MTHLLNSLIAAARNQSRYSRTRAELSRLPIDSRLDLGIHDIDETARSAVWG